MQLLSAFITAFLCCALPASAGPWARTVGQVFISLSAEQDREGNRYTSLYSEYGWSERDTYGLKLGHSDDETSALVWLQRAYEYGAHRLSFHLGFGAFQRDDELVGVNQLGLAWGRGLDGLPLLERLPGGGWLSVEAEVKLASKMVSDAALEDAAMAEDYSALNYLTPEMMTKGQATFGWNAMAGLMLINQLQLEDRDDTGFSSKFALSLVRDLAGPAKIELGTILPLTGEGEKALKLGTWLEF